METGTIWRHLLQTLRSKPEETAELEIICILFTPENMLLVYRKFTKFEIGEADETSVLYVIRLDAITTDAIDSLTQLILETEQLIGKINRLHVSTTSTSPTKWLTKEMPITIEVEKFPRSQRNVSKTFFHWRLRSFWASAKTIFVSGPQKIKENYQNDMCLFHRNQVWNNQ